VDKSPDAAPHPNPVLTDLTRTPPHGGLPRSEGSEQLDALVADMERRAPRRRRAR
jgi:hypothetical protein